MISEQRTKLIYPLSIFITALFLRLLYLAQSSANPTFLSPIVDSYAYHLLALSILDGTATGEALFWQPLFYPSFLALVYKTAGISFWAPRILQALAGSFSCVLVYYTASMALSRRTGLIAGLLMAFYGPLIFIEGELLAEGWAVFWIACLIPLLMLTIRKDHPLIYILTGLCGAMAVLTRPPLLIFFIAACVGQTIILSRQVPLKQALVRLAIIAVGFGFLALPVARMNRNLTGQQGFLPSSGGINLYIGNNPDWVRTVMARPGFEWRSVYRLPYKDGCTNNWEASAWFREKTLQFAKEQPDIFLRGLLQKTSRFFSSREIPRNLDIYLFRQWAPLLSALVWKNSGFGFPFGIFLPLVLLGLALNWRRIPWPIWALLIFYPPVIILHFVAARYRLLIMPAAAVAAAAGLAGISGFVQKRRWNKALACAIFIAVLAVACSFPLSYPEERVNFEAEMYRGMGHKFSEQKLFSAAIPYLEISLSLQPDYLNALNDMSIILTEMKRPEEALQYAERALALRPDFGGLSYNLGLIHLELNNLYEAEKNFRNALACGDEGVHVHINLGITLSRRERFEEASDQFRKALELDAQNKAARTFLEQAEKSSRGHK
ncbi:MAG: tetratricopeptide repeat protein [Kiritimatiellia bacterium]